MNHLLIDCYLNLSLCCYQMIYHHNHLLLLILIELFMTNLNILIIDQNILSSVQLNLIAICPLFDCYSDKLIGDF